MAKKQPDQTETNREEEIRELAQQKWQQAGCPPGDGTEFWYAAEKELAQRNSPSSKPRPK
jgi:hypothetical protein